MNLPSLTHLLDALAGRRQARDADDDPELVNYFDPALHESVDRTEHRTPGWTPETPTREPLPTRIPSPIETGEIDDWEIETYLADMRRVWDANGGTDTRISPEEFCRLPKVKGKVFAIPDRMLWPWTAYLIEEAWAPLRDACGPMSLRGYRPPAYNEAVGGSRRSDHMWAVAFDLRPAGGQHVDTLKYEAAKLYVRRGRELKMGFGVYRANIHVGVGIRCRHWGEAAKWVKKAKQFANEWTVV